MTKKRKVVIASVIGIAMVLAIVLPALAGVLWGPYGSPYVRVENPNGRLSSRGQDNYPDWAVQGTPVFNETVCNATSMYACRCWVLPVTGTSSTRVRCFLDIMTPTPAPTMHP